MRLAAQRIVDPSMKRLFLDLAGDYDRRAANAQKAEHPKLGGFGITKRASGK